MASAAATPTSPHADGGARKRLWTVWAILTLAVTTWQAATLTITPTGWQDEAQLTEIGRLVLEPHSTWSIEWLPQRNAPLHAFTYVAGLAQELAFRIHPGYAAVRAFDLVGAMAASAACLWWLLARGSPPALSLAFSLIFFLDPLFVSCYRKGRADGWALCFAFAALVFARRRWRHSMMFAGAVMAISVFLSPTAILVLPLCWNEWKDNRTSWRPFIAGALIVAAAVLLPLYPTWREMWQDLGIAITSNAQPSPAFLRAAYDTLVFSAPLFLMITTAALLTRRRLAAITLAIFLVIAATRFYEARVIYLLPYGLALLADAIRQSPFARRWHIATAVALLWAATFTLVFRPAIALRQRQERDVSRLVAVTRAIPAQSAIYLGAWELYYAGRMQQWQMFRSYGDQSDRAPLLARMDYAIFSAAEDRPEFRREMQAAGLSLHSVWLPQTGAGTKIFGQWLGQPYGPYLVFARHNPPLGVR